MRIRHDVRVRRSLTLHVIVYFRVYYFRVYKILITARAVLKRPVLSA